MDVDQDDSLIEEITLGSQEAFSKFVRIHQGFVRAYLGRYIRNKETIDDLAQETFLAAYRSLANFRGESSIRVWLLGIARNIALMYLRQEQRRRTHMNRALESALSGWFADAAEQGEPAGFELELSALEGCLKSLPEASASLVAEYYFKGRKAVDIARTIGKSETAMGVTLLRIRQSLRRCIEGRLAPGGGSA